MSAGLTLKKGLNFLHGFQYASIITKLLKGKPFCCSAVATHLLRGLLMLGKCGRKSQI
jgi:hypothetical protein